ncbi:MAG: M20/M25/M40 family metallo-hydrolase [Clostridia bacterium]|nr:M20/M25/M40 family metallo-hydrolase [Clostridia bacterium]
MQILDTIKELNACFGPSGCEEEIRNKIAELAKPFADEMYTDVMGNLIVVKKAAGKRGAAKADNFNEAKAGAEMPAAAKAGTPRLMFAAHMDSLGLIVTYIEENGLLRFGVVGLVEPTDLKAIPVRFANGTVGTVYSDTGADKPGIDDLFIDIGASSRKEAEKLVQKGDMAVFDTPARALAGDLIVSPYLDNRAGAAAQLLALAAVKKPAYDCCFVFTTQEEVGRRGAKPAAFGVDPQYAVVCDATRTDDQPKSRHQGTTIPGKGAAIKVMDKSVICHPEMVAALKAIADEKKIAWQTDVLQEGGTDGTEMRKTAGGVWTGGVSIPVRYVHSPQEVCCTADIEAAARLMAAFAETKPGF